MARFAAQILLINVNGFILIIFSLKILDGHYTIFRIGLYLNGGGVLTAVTS